MKIKDLAALPSLSAVDTALGPALLVDAGRWSRRQDGTGRHIEIRRCLKHQAHDGVLILHLIRPSERGRVEIGDGDLIAAVMHAENLQLPDFGDAFEESDVFGRYLLDVVSSRSIRRPIAASELPIRIEVR